MENKNLTVQEAADVLNVRRERIWKLLHDGVLTARPSKLDGRQKLIPRELVEALLLEEGYRPRQTTQRNNGAAAEMHTGIDTATNLNRSRPEAGEASAGLRIWPDSIGMIEDGTVSSSESGEYLRSHFEGEPSRAE